LGALVNVDSSITLVSGVKPYVSEDSRVYSPQEPTLVVKSVDNSVSIDVTSKYNVNLYRNGELIQKNVIAQSYSDTPTGFACYLAESINDK
ncbi:hypothetical protein OFN42_32910, partial [Escherichia coli]|nr:hypothetical protein [Escherichia coli]